MAGLIMIKIIILFSFISSLPSKTESLFQKWEVLNYQELPLEASQD
jgi:hypothetical protein